MIFLEERSRVNDQRIDWKKNHGLTIREFTIAVSRQDDTISINVCGGHGGKVPPFAGSNITAYLHALLRTDLSAYLFSNEVIFALLF